MPNICFLLGGFQNNGGIGRVTSVISTEMAKRKDYKVTTISYFQTEDNPLYTIGENIKQVVLYPSQISMVSAIFKNHAIKKVKKIIRDEKIDVIIACGALFYPLAILACKGTQAKCVCWEHTNPSVVRDYKFQGFARSFAVQFADSVVVLTKSAKKYYLEKLGIKEGKICQIYNPISQNAMKSSQYNSSSKRIISVGRLSYPKNFSLLIDIAAKVLPNYPQWNWDIYGSGEEHEALLKKIKEKGLEGRVNLKGQVEDIYERYGQYAFQVMTSRYEGFPMSLIEGAANRLPIVSFDIETGPNEIIKQGENGFLIEKENQDDMIEKICLLMEDSSLREKMSEKAIESVKIFDMDEIIERWCEICQVE